jgi:Ca2+-binding EF-hand superfamily protein
MKEKLFSLLTFVFILFSCSIVFAQETPKKVFDLMDANQDGKVTKKEFMTFYLEYATKIREARFDQLDTNGDGKISRKEFMAVQIEEAKKIGKFRFQRIDANKDGIISEEELKKRFRLVKQSLDALKAE